MTTTTPQSPGPEPVPDAGPPTGPRQTRLIHGETTTEIPVHLLFRDDPVGYPSTGPAVVGRRRGTGELPRTPAYPAARFGIEVDPGIEERAARVVPGAVGAVAGLAGVAGCGAALWWAGLLPLPALWLLGLVPRPAVGLGLPVTLTLAGAGAVALLGFGGLARGRSGRAWVLTLFGRYRGTVRATGLLWVNPLLLRRRADVRLRHWRSEPMPAVDAEGLAVRVVLLVVWRVADTARALLAVDDHQAFLRETAEAAVAAARVRSRFPADVEALGRALTTRVAEGVRPVGLEVFSVHPSRIDYEPDAAALLRRRHLAALGEFPPPGEPEHPTAF
ncbi:SPFH domain-containing protein [Streptomyces sp. NPDC058045]|uniref:SPFH domain-containing protein n=1 Tax=Streptomyces sp. NPDC058045 TaxID=3346311 RepID=UPI0036E60E5E